MSRRFRIIVFTLSSVLVLLFLTTGSSWAAPPSITITDLGTLGGTNSNPTAVDGSVVVGSADTAAGVSHAFAYDLSAAVPQMIDLGTLGGGFSVAYGVSGSVVVGSADTAVGVPHAFAYDLSAAVPQMIDLGTLGGTRSNANAVSGSIVVGWSQTATGATHAFAYDLSAAAPQMIDLGVLGVLGDPSSTASAVSDSIVVGWSDAAVGQHAFAYDVSAAAPQMIDLGTLGGMFSTGEGVSGRIVVGGAQTVAGVSHAFAYDLSAAAPQMIDLGTLGGTGSVAFGVSGSVVVGSADTTVGVPHAFAYDLSAAVPQMIDLGTLGGTTSAANGVSGSIVVGSARTAASATHAFAYDLSAAAPQMIDLGTLGGGFSAASKVSGSVVIGNSQTTGNVAYHAVVWQLGPSGSVDADGDGIDDAIDTGTGTFVDGGTTAGTVGAVPAGYAVAVTDLPDPDGVHIVVTGTGTEKVTIVLTNPVTGVPCGTVKLLPGADMEFTCGSITTHALVGSAEIVLSNDTSVFVDAPEKATVSIAADGSFVVAGAVQGGDGRLRMVNDGVQTLVDQTSPRIQMWDFVGFLQPVDNSGAINVAKGGSIIPLKWRLLTEAGAPVTNLASASVAVVAADCASGSATEDAIEEVTPSASGLMNLGNGYYQLNWKTPKTTGCKLMKLSLAGEGAISHNALFKFK